MTNKMNYGKRFGQGAIGTPSGRNFIGDLNASTMYLRYLHYVRAIRRAGHIPVPYKEFKLKHTWDPTEEEYAAAKHKRIMRSSASHRGKRMKVTLAGPKP